MARASFSIAILTRECCNDADCGTEATCTNGKCKVTCNAGFTARGSACLDQEPTPAPKDFQILPQRWVVERTFGRPGRWRCLKKDAEELPTTEAAWVYLATWMLMLARLAR